MTRIAVVGAGILGLTLARAVAAEHPDWHVTVLEKEPAVAAHQTSHNSGVVHAGVYYQPGSLKATLCRRGAVLLRDFCQRHSIPYQACGKLIVAVNDAEAGRLAELNRRATANGVPGVTMVGPAGIRRIEPHVRGVGGLHSPSTAVVDFAAVARAVETGLRAAGHEIRLGTAVTGLRETRSEVVLHTPAGDLLADRVITCTGLHADRLAAQAGDRDDCRIVPFRGEYHRLTRQAGTLVRGLVYPVPDPRYPFLGVHLTRRADGTVDAGPNAVLALAREGYRRAAVSARDLREMLAWPGFARMARAHWRTGVREMATSLSRRYFLRQARRYVPELTLADFDGSHAGVRAQAVTPDGGLVDDFRISRAGRAGRLVAVRNAPSPAATSSFAIAEYLCRHLAID
jgi:L-2-hydroxyglutarate oxidase LhgO